jgi:hypothetical protein
VSLQEVASRVVELAVVAQLVVVQLAEELAVAA